MSTKNDRWLEYAECRLETGHRWRTVKDLGVIGADWTKLQRCQGCSMTRRRGWNVWTGKLTPHTYAYVEGYLQSPGGKRLSLAEQRIMYSRKALHIREGGRYERERKAG